MLVRGSMGKLVGQFNRCCVYIYIHMQNIVTPKKIEQSFKDVDDIYSILPGFPTRRLQEGDLRYESFHLNYIL